MTFAEFESFVSHLPAESAYQTAVRDQFTDAQLSVMHSDKHGTWSQQDMLLAVLIDHVAMLIHVQISKAGVTQEPPEPLSRPGVITSRPDASQQSAVYQARLAAALAWREANDHE